MGKRRSEAASAAEDADESGVKESNWDELISRLEPIAHPLAPKKLTKKLYKIIKKGGSLSDNT